MKFLIRNYKKDEIMSTAGEEILAGLQDVLAIVQGDETKGRSHTIITSKENVESLPEDD